MGKMSLGKFIFRSIAGVVILSFLVDGAMDQGFVIGSGIVFGNLFLPMFGMIFKKTVSDEIASSHEYHTTCGRGVRPAHAGQVSRCAMCPYKNRSGHGLACSYWDGYWH